MLAECAVYTLLDGLPQLSGRVHALSAPEAAVPPFAVYQRVGGQGVASLSGPSGLAQPRIQVTVYAVTYLEAKEIANAVRMRLDGFRGSVAGVRVGGIALQVELDRYESEATPPLYAVVQDYFVTHNH